DGQTCGDGAFEHRAGSSTDVALVKAGLHQRHEVLSLFADRLTVAEQIDRRCRIVGEVGDGDVIAEGIGPGDILGGTVRAFVLNGDESVVASGEAGATRGGDALEA